MKTRTRETLQGAAAWLTLCLVTLAFWLGVDDTAKLILIAVFALAALSLGLSIGVFDQKHHEDEGKDSRK